MKENLIILFCGIAIGMLMGAAIVHFSIKNNPPENNPPETKIIEKSVYAEEDKCKKQGGSFSWDGCYDWNPTEHCIGKAVCNIRKEIPL